MVDVDSTITVKEGVLNTRSNIRYNERPYSFELSVTSNPSFKFIMEWEGLYILTSNEIIHFAFKRCMSLLDKMGNHEELMVEGSIVMDESAVISATRIQNNGKDIMPVGYLKKFLDEKHWWETNNHLSSEQSNEIWVCTYSIINFFFN